MSVTSERSTEVGELAGQWNTTTKSHGAGIPACTSSTGCATWTVGAVFETAARWRTWYWNRYPGARSIRELDVRLFFDDEILQDGNGARTSRRNGDASLLQLRRGQAGTPQRHHVQTPVPLGDVDETDNCWELENDDGRGSRRVSSSARWGRYQRTRCRTSGVDGFKGGLITPLAAARTSDVEGKAWR